MSNLPENKFKAGPVSASVFVNQFETQTGPKTARNVVLERTYKDKDGQFKASKSLSERDVPKAILVLQQAYAFMVQSGPPAEPSSVSHRHQQINAEPSQ